MAESVLEQQRAASRNRLLAFWDSTIGKKVVMALTGAVMVLFIIGHVLGNLKIFSGPAEINSYALFLREAGAPEFGYGELLWVMRSILLLCVGLHILAAVQLTRSSWKARPVGYAKKKDVEASVGSRTMRWGGVLIAVFVVFHILHFTLGDVGFQPGQFEHLMVYHNVVAGFSVWPIAVFYIIAVGALCLHLDHGVWSVLQTLGWSSAQSQRRLKICSRIFAILIFIGFVSVPIAVMAGWLR